MMVQGRDLMESSAISNESVNEYGLTEVYCPADGIPRVDVVFVHGVGGHPYHTWRSEGNGTFWPAQLLPSVLQEQKARILVYGYDTDGIPSLESGETHKHSALALGDRIHNHGESLIAKLCANRARRKANERPIIFVTHGVGGLVVKRALIYSSEISGHNTSHLRSIFVSTYGILFLATPHIRKGNETIQNINRLFIHIHDKLHIYYFHEGKPTIVNGRAQYLVEEESAAPVEQDVERACIQRDHARICQFENIDSPGYDLVTEAIQRYASDAPEKIKADWKHERLNRKMRIENQIRELGRTNDPNNGQVENFPKRNSGDVHSAVRPPCADKRTDQYHKRLYIVSRQRVRNFVGREEELRQIRSRFSAKPELNRPQTLVLHALGGQGKSQIALEYCESSREKYAGVFWINASSEALATQAYGHIAPELGGTSPATMIDDDRAVDVVKEYLENWIQPWLLVFDNYDNPNLFPHISKFLPRFGQGHVIITSRNRDLDRLGHLIEIPPMTSDEGVKLLLQKYNDEAVQQHYAIASCIVDRLGALPLAIDQAAAYIQSEYHESALHRLDEFLTKYEYRRERILSYTPDKFWEYGTMQIHGQENRNKAISAFTTWEMSLEQLQGSEDYPKSEMIHFLTISAFLNPARIEEWLFYRYCQTWGAVGFCNLFTTAVDPCNDVPYEASIAGSDPESKGNINDADKEIAHSSRLVISEDEELPAPSGGHVFWSSDKFWSVLCKFFELSLIQSLERIKPNAIFSLHPLIRDWLQLRVRADGHLQYVKESMQVLVACAWAHDTSPLSLDDSSALLSHVDTCLANDEKLCLSQWCLMTDKCDLASFLGDFYNDRGHFEAWGRLMRRVVQTRTQILGLENEDTLRSLHHVASSLFMQFHFQEAEELHRHTLQLRIKVLGEKCQDTMDSRFSLAVTLGHLEKHEEAEKILRQALQWGERSLGAEARFTMQVRTMLARSLRNQGNPEEAEEIQRATLHSMEKILGKEHWATLICAGSLAKMLWHQSKYEEAEMLGTQVFRSRRATLGEKHPHTLTGMHNLALTQRSYGKLDEARSMLSRALLLNMEVRGKKHPDTLRTMKRLAMMQQNRGMSKSKVHRKSFALSKRTLIDRFRRTKDLQAIAEVT